MENISCVVFARLKKKRSYYAVAMSVRLSVRVFRTFLTRFEISIWNFVYTFGRWHNRSSLSFIAIRWLWTTLQPKEGPMHIFCFRGLINQDKSSKFGTQVALCTFLGISTVFRNIFFSEFWQLFCAFWVFRSFPDFFLHVLRYQFETWYIHPYIHPSDLVHTLIWWVSWPYCFHRWWAIFGSLGALVAKTLGGGAQQGPVSI